MRRPVEAVSDEAAECADGEEPEDSTEEFGDPSRYKDSDEGRWDLSVLYACEGNSVRSLRVLCWRSVL